MWAAIDDLSEWNKALRALPWPHLLQSWEWGEFKSRWGWSAERWLLRAPDGAPRAAVQVLRRRLGRLPFCVLYVPKGPACADEAAFLAALDWLAARARAVRALWVKIDGDPHLAQPPAERPQALARYRALLTQRGWRYSPSQVQFRNTAHTELRRSDEALLATMKPKTRYNIGLARRRGVTVRAGSVEDAPLFYSLLRTTAERDQFSIHTLDYYRDFLRLFAQGEDAPARLLIAEYQQQPLAALVVAAVGERAIYLYGASSDQQRELMPTYLLQWEAMLWARRRGCKTYDLWGIPDEDEATLEANFERRSDGLWGVYRFKRGFGGQVVRYIGAWVDVRSPLRWWLFQQACRWRKTTGLAA